MPPLFKNTNFSLKQIFNRIEKPYNMELTCRPARSHAATVLLNQATVQRPCSGGQLQRFVTFHISWWQGRFLFNFAQHYFKSFLTIRLIISTCHSVWPFTFTVSRRLLMIPAVKTLSWPCHHAFSFLLGRGLRAIICFRPTLKPL